MVGDRRGSLDETPRDTGGPWEKEEESKGTFFSPFFLLPISPRTSLDNIQWRFESESVAWRDVLRDEGVREACVIVLPS